MTPLLSAWLESMGNHLWQSTLFAAMAGLLTLALRRNRAQVRHWVWLAASVKFLVPFAAIVALGSRFGWRVAAPVQVPALTFAWDAVSQPLPSDLRTSIASSSAHAWSGIAAAIPWALLAIWIGGSLAILMMWLGRWRRVVAIVRSAEDVEFGRELDALRRLECVSGIKNPVTLLAAEGSLEPGVFGLIRPVLLWPRGISECLDDAQIEAILAHELAHVRRRDNLAATLHMLVEAAFWFHPLVWWLGGRLVEERERSCDEDVIRLGSEPQLYAESILKTCEFCIESPLVCVAGVTGADLKRRIEEIIRNDAGEALNAWKKLLLATAGLAAIAMPIALGALSAPRLQAQSPAAVLSAQAPAKALAFEVASIKPNKSDAPGVGMGFAQDGIRARNTPPATMLWMALGVQPDQIVDTPSWATTERFDINAKVAPGEVFNTAMFGPMLLNLLAERFQLKMHHETRELNVYRLVRLRADRLGPKLDPAPIDACAAPAQTDAASLRAAARGCSAGPVAGGISVHGMSIATLASLMGPSAGRVIVDATELTGNWDLDLTFVNQVQSADGDGPSLFTALQEQLGLKLEPGRAPVDVVVIDHLKRPTED